MDIPAVLEALSNAIGSLQGLPDAVEAVRQIKKRTLNLIERKELSPTLPPTVKRLVDPLTASLNAAIDAFHARKETWTQAEFEIEQARRAAEILALLKSIEQYIEGADQLKSILQTYVEKAPRRA